MGNFPAGPTPSQLSDRQDVAVLVGIGGREATSGSGQSGQSGNRMGYERNSEGRPVLSERAGGIVRVVNLAGLAISDLHVPFISCDLWQDRVFCPIPMRNMQ